MEFNLAMSKSIKNYSIFFMTNYLKNIYNKHSIVIGHKFSDI